jgi:hypothetical protein
LTHGFAMAAARPSPSLSKKFRGSFGVTKNPGLATGADQAAIAYAGTFSALAFRSHVTPNVASAPLNHCWLPLSLPSQVAPVVRAALAIPLQLFFLLCRLSLTRHL